jgi:hypothetical protein
MHGAALIVHREWSQRAGPTLLKISGFIAIPLTFFWVIFAFVPFRSADVYVDAKTKNPLRSMPDGFYEIDGEKVIHKRTDLERDPLTGNWRKSMVNVAQTQNIAPAAPQRDPAIEVEPVDDDAAPAETPPAPPRRDQESLKGPAEASARGVAAVSGKSDAPVVVSRVAGSFGATALIWQSALLFKDHGNHSVVGNAMVILMVILVFVHWVNYRRLLATWWRRIPDFVYAALLGAGVAVALFMKPIHYKAFIYFQF